MKLKSFFVCLLSLFIALAASDVQAQTRKSTTKSCKTTSTSTKKAAPTATKANIADTKYIGLGSASGQPIDFWIEFNFEATEATMSMAGAYSFDGKYNATTTGKTINVSIPFNEKIKANLKSTDNGSSMEGILNLNGNSVKLWLVKIPQTLTEDNLSSDELEKIFSNSDGYTSLVKIRQGDGLLCVPSDFSTDPNSKTWSMRFDNSYMQKMFNKFEGTYSVSGSNIELVFSSGLKKIVKSYDNGNYIEVPLGSSHGMTFTLILIR